MDLQEWEALEEAIRQCKGCELWKNRKNAVPGEGNKSARIVLVGEAPGRKEDEQGRPFVGPAGKFLNELLSILGLKREEVYITNVVKCRPPGNREPNEREVKACSRYLEKQLSLLRPEIIIALGSCSLKYFSKKFFGREMRISEMHGKILEVNTLFGKILLVPMYHPAAALYNPAKKEEIIEDWKKLSQVLVARSTQKF